MSIGRNSVLAREITRFFLSSFFSLFFFFYLFIYNHEFCRGRWSRCARNRLYLKVNGVIFKDYIGIIMFYMRHFAVYMYIGGATVLVYVTKVF